MLEKRLQATTQTFVFQEEADVWVLISIIINEISMEEIKKNVRSFQFFPFLSLLTSIKTTDEFIRL